MTDLTVRPTAKFLRAGMVIAILVFLALEFLIFYQVDGFSLVLLLPLVVLIWPAARAIRRHFTRIVMTGDRLRYETGLLSKSTRTIQISKIQDVRVDQSLLQRVFNVGNLSIETAGETSRLTILNVDEPQPLADEILTRSQHHAAGV